VNYKVLSKQQWSFSNYSIVPIRQQDRYAIMKWRNEQIYHLRQSEPLTPSDQDRYFEEVVAKLFDREQPDQILFSYLEGDKCIGYGGLVHINWTDKNAELSFLMDTDLEENRFGELWSAYLPLIEQVAFEELRLHKIYTYAFDLRPHLYDIIERAGFLQEARLKEHVFIQSEYIDVLIHSKLNTL
jgi:RimJ/RimL family protein N-acetyltransferase